MGTTEPQSFTDTGLSKIAWLSKQNREQTYSSLLHHINVESLRNCFEKLDGKKATGVDGITKAEYACALEVNLQALTQQMKRMAYRPQAVREVLIPKEGQKGKTRPLGISTIEDKIVQKRMQEILESIYEPVFVDWSYGFRPGRSAHDAIKSISDYLFRNEVEIVLDVDLANFFGTINHDKLKDLLRLKIKDTKFIRYDLGVPLDIM